MNVKQASQIEVGQPLPAAYIEVVSDNCAADDCCPTQSTIDPIFADGKSLIIGMPGAFTPTCTDEHLPGFIRNAQKFRKLGVKNLNVVTTNDKYIMTAWKKAMKDCMKAEGISSLDSQVDQGPHRAHTCHTACVCTLSHCTHLHTVCVCVCVVCVCVWCPGA